MESKENYVPEACEGGKERTIRFGSSGQNGRHISRELIRQYQIRLMEDEKSEATIRQYTNDIKKFAEFAGDEQVKKEMVIRYKQYLVTKYAVTSVNTRLAAINGFFKFMEWCDCVVKSLKVQKDTFRSSHRDLSRKEYYCLLEAAKKQGNYRLYLLMQALCATGIRVSELRFLTVEAVQAGWAEVTLKGKTRVVLLPKPLCRILKSYIKEKHICSGSIFTTRSGRPMDRSNICHEMKALCETAGIERTKVFPHNLRHLFACTYYKVEKDLTRLADLLGHSSINTTRIYTLSSGEEQLRQIDMLGLVK